MGGLEVDYPARLPYDVDYVTGAGMLLRVAMIRQVGLIPEDWFLYFEETEYNLRARDAGWRIMVDPRSRLHHFQRSTGQLPRPTYIYYFVRNRYRFGIERAGASPDEVESDLAGFVAAWRQKAELAKPEWVPTYDLLVTTAKDDGLAGKTGWRDLTPLLQESV
jgi:hypothetical protein